MMGANLDLWDLTQRRTCSRAELLRYRDIEEAARALSDFEWNEALFTYGDATESWSRIEPDDQKQLEALFDNLRAALNQEVTAAGTAPE